MTAYNRHVRKHSPVGKVGDRPNRRQDSQTPFLRGAGLYLGVAFELPGTILGGLVVGYFLDEYFGTSPWLLITLTVLAFVGAFVRLVRWVKFFARELMEAAAKKTILRIELWHGVLLLALLVTLGRSKWIDSNALLVGGIFMGVNFFLLS